MKTLSLCLVYAVAFFTMWAHGTSRSKDSPVTPNVSKLKARTVRNQSTEERTNVVSTLWHRVQAKVLFPHIPVSPRAVETFSRDDTMEQLMAHFKPSLLLKKLTKIYGEEQLMRALVHVIHSSNGPPTTKTFASTLLDKQLGKYVDRDLDIAAFIKVVHLRPKLVSLTNEKMAIVKRFHELLNEKSGGHVSFLDVVASVFGGLKTLTVIVNRAKFDVEAKPLALRVEQALIKDWLPKNLHPQHVLQMLELDESEDGTWHDYSHATLQKEQKESEVVQEKSQADSEVEMKSVKEKKRSHDKKKGGKNNARKSHLFRTKIGALRKRRRSY
ncbi:hypothetical protein PsorP6_000792 [Peronosclerospora sorghi]|uniref:Uncharacterized protein n=1 Tax=Peronosclerospora sorghi TaxID=230839 RepID=A0ACC0WQ71_9STRA|nr:hypothetical protein PsorP6_000792 [Peronosclerospora sorghi]